MEEITYELILQYLTNKISNTGDFPTQKNLLKYSTDFPEKFKQLFESKFYRYGIQVYDFEQNNISFWSSFFYLLNKKFILMDKEEQISYINLMKNQIIDYMMENHKYFELKKQFSKSVIKEKIQSNNFNDLFIEIVCFIFGVNILIFDFKEEEINTAYNGIFFNPWKPVLILGNYNDLWEPISYEKKIFNINDKFIKTILFEEIKYYKADYFNKEYNLIDNIHDIIEIEKENDEDYIKTETETSFISKNVFKLGMTKSKLNKMKKIELIKIVNDLNLDITKLKPTKKDLINIILN